MKLKKAWEIRNNASSTASKVVRQLALAGIAVVWLLAGGLQTSGINLTTRLLFAGFALALSLFLDLTQYVVKAIVWGLWARKGEKTAQGWKKDDRKAWNRKKVIDEEAEDLGEAPDWFNVPSWWFWSLKVAAMVAAYVLIFIDLVDRINLS